MRVFSLLFWLVVVGFGFVVCWVVCFFEFFGDCRGMWLSSYPKTVSNIDMELFLVVDIWDTPDINRAQFTRGHCQPDTQVIDRHW